MDTEDITWEDIYQKWRYRCGEIFEPILNDAGFEVRELELTDIMKAQGNNERYYIDWVPKKDVENEIKVITQDPLQTVWRTGHITTAKMLWDHKDNPEAMALIWIGAAIRSMDNGSFIRGQMFDKLININKVVLDKMHEMSLEIWNANIKYPLPVSICNNGSYQDLFDPSSTEDLLNLIFLEAIIARTTCQLLYMHFK